MRIAVLGATGMVGSRVVAEAAGRAHEVVAASRRVDSSPGPAGVRPVSIDMASGAGLYAALREADAAVLAVRPEAGREGDIAAWTERALHGASEAACRVLVVGGAGPLRSPRDPDLMVVDDPAYVPAQWRTVAAASVAQLDVCQRFPNVPWTYLSPPAVLEAGARTGRYRRGTTSLLVDRAGQSSISAEDLAVAVVDELERPRSDRHVTVAAWESAR